MARPARPASTTMLFRITIQRPGRLFGRPLRRRTGLRSRRPRRYVRFTSSRRAMPPFFLFMARHRRRVQRNYPHLTMAQTARRLGRMWHRLPESTKEMYKLRAEELRGTRVRRFRSRFRSRSRRPMSSRRRAMRNLMISFTTRAASLRNFLLSYL